MSDYDNLVSFLRGLDDFFIEVEGKPDQLKKFIAEYNSKLNKSVDLQTEGICELDSGVNKRGLEFRLYTNERPTPFLGNKFHVSQTYRSGYRYRLSNNDLIKTLLYNGFDLGYN